jgi:hypothetical protein
MITKVHQKVNHSLYICTIHLGHLLMLHTHILISESLKTKMDVISSH